MMILTASKGNAPLCNAGLGRAVVTDRLPLQQSRLRQGSRMLKDLAFRKKSLHRALPVLITNQHGHVCAVRMPNLAPVAL